LPQTSQSSHCCHCGRKLFCSIVNYKTYHLTFRSMF
jgi:hypothetical protein